MDKQIVLYYYIYTMEYNLAKRKKKKKKKKKEADSYTSNDMNKSQIIILVERNQA